MSSYCEVRPRKEKPQASALSPPGEEELKQSAHVVRIDTPSRIRNDGIAALKIEHDAAVGHELQPIERVVHQVHEHWIDS